MYVVKLDIATVGKLYIYIKVQDHQKGGLFDAEFGGTYHKRNRTIEEPIIIWLKFGSFVI